MATDESRKALRGELSQICLKYRRERLLKTGEIAECLDSVHVFFISELIYDMYIDELRKAVKGLGGEHLL